MLRKAWYLGLWAVCLAPCVFARDSALLRVGEAQLSASQFAQRLAEVPDFQRQSWAKTNVEQARYLLNQYLIPEFLWVEEANARHLKDTPRVQELTRSALARLWDDTLREQELRERPITAQEIEQYYNQHVTQFQLPRRLRIWRIVVSTRDAAQKIIDAASQPSGVDAFKSAAREQSLDKATAFRAGDLGFVRPDGSTDAPSVRVSAAVFAAAEPLKDGELLKTPVEEDGKFFVVWRRGSLAAEGENKEQSHAAIRFSLERERVAAARSARLAKLRAEHGVVLHPELLDKTAP